MLHSHFVVAHFGRAHHLPDALDPAPGQHLLERDPTHLIPKSGFREETEIRYSST